MLLFLMWFAAFAVALHIYFRKVYSVFSRAGVKSQPPIPLLGNMAGIILQREHISKHIERLYFNNPTERFVGRFEFLSPSLVVRDLELVKKIVVKDFEHFVDHRTLIDGTVDTLFGRGVFNMKGQEWKDMRSTLSPAFTSSKMKLMVPFMVEAANQMMAALKQRIENSHGHVDLNVIDLCSRYGNDVVASCAFGTKVDSHLDANNYFYTMGKNTAKLGYKEMMKIFGHGSFPNLMRTLKIGILTEASKNFFRNLVLLSMKIREEKNIVRNDIIHLLMEAKKGKLSHEINSSNETDFGFAVVEESTVGKRTVNRDWADDDLVAQAMGFFFAGFDTVSSGMAFVLHELALNPDIQDRLSQEVQENDAKTGGTFDYKSIQTMKYLDMVVCESLRKWTPGTWLDSVCTKDYNCGKPNDKAQKDFILRKGQGVTIPAWAIHRDPQYFPDPLKFDPERFSDENKHKINPYTYMPFGLGPRSCIGSRFALCEIKVLVYTVLRQVEVFPCKKTCLPEQLESGTINTRLKGGHWLRFKMRKVE